MGGGISRISTDSQIMWDRLPEAGISDIASLHDLFSEWLI
jgi:hypothetical protein